MHQATLRLFNAIQIEDATSEAIPADILARTIQNGYLLSPTIRPEASLLDAIEDVVGISGEKANAAFHKSWAAIRDKPIRELVLQQILHYITTYGFDAVGIYQADTVYIPNEMLNLQSVREDMPLVVIKGLTAQEIFEKIIALGAGIALAEETLNDIMTIIKANRYDGDFVETIANRELKTRLIDLYGLIPSDPVEFLRYLISKLTGESLLIKNQALIDKIKAADGRILDDALYDAPDDLATLFLRYKPLFLAMKSISRNKTFFNRLRKQADKSHKPLPEDYLNSVTKQVKQKRLDVVTLEQRLSKATIFRKIRLAYALKYRLHATNSIVYRVRNGRGWAAPFAWAGDLAEDTQQALDIVLASIADDLRANVEGKTIYIPDNVHYALPATEKQFTGHLPTGSYVSVPQDMIVGIHWTNTDKVVDLDLSVIGEDGKFGWDAAYRDDDRSVLFSGDVTSAPPPNGASELFYLQQGMSAKIMLVNYYNFSKGAEVQTRILVAHEKPDVFEQNYMVDINNIVATATINITKKQNVLGFITSVDGENRFYFANVSIGNSITSQKNETSTHTRKYFVSRFVNTLSFKEILTNAGAIVVGTKPEDDYLDLSPTALNKAIIIDLMQGIPSEEDELVEPSAHTHAS